jgi:hypothetical protein
LARAMAVDGVVAGCGDGGGRVGFGLGWYGDVHKSHVGLRQSARWGVRLDLP